MAMKNNYPSQKNRSTLAISPLRLTQAKQLAELWGEGWTARLVAEYLIKKEFNKSIGETKMKTRIIDRETREVICEVVTNRSMTFDEVAKLGGLEWHEYPDLPDPNGYTGWYDSAGTYWNEEVAEMETAT